MEIKGPVNGEPASFQFDGNDIKAMEGFIRERLNEIYSPALSYRVKIGRFLIRIGKALARDQLIQYP